VKGGAGCRSEKPSRELLLPARFSRRRGAGLASSSGRRNLWADEPRRRGGEAVKCRARVVPVWSRGTESRPPPVENAASVGGGLPFLYLRQFSLRVRKLTRKIIPLISYLRRVFDDHLDNLSLPGERSGRRGRPQTFNGLSKLVDLFSQSGDFCR
jgi:hypothetical protein